MLNKPQKSAKRKSAVLIYGNDEFLVSTEARDIINTHIPSDRHELGLSVIDGSARKVDEALYALKQCNESIRTLGFLGRKVVWLKNASFLGNDPISRSKDVQEAVGSLASAVAAGLPPNHMLVVTSSSVNAGSEFLKICRRHGEVTRFESRAPWEQDKEAVRLVASAFKRHGLRASANVLNAFLAKSGNDARTIAQEADKLAIYMSGKQDVRENDVESIVTGSREAFVWTFQDAVANRNTAESLKILHQLLFQNEDPIGLVTCLENRFRQLAVLREALEKGWIRGSAGKYGRSAFTTDAIPKDVENMLEDALSTSRGRMTPGAKSRLAGQAGGFTNTELAACRNIILETRRALVSSSAPGAMLLEMLIIKLCRKAARNA